jgi:hypothetical protein
VDEKDLTKVLLHTVTFANPEQEAKKATILAAFATETLRQSASFEQRARGLDADAPPEPLSLSDFARILASSNFKTKMTLPLLAEGD